MNRAIDQVSSAAALAKLAEVAAKLGETGLEREALELARRTSEGRFFVACIGQFKRGKSSLINALVGSPLLPTGIVPLTSVPTIVRYGTSVHARVRIRSEDWTEIPVAVVHEYVSEEGNPGNCKRVEGVEVYAPSSILENGMCLVDTPGLGSIFTANGEATRSFVPQIDAAILVLGADPPISAEEMSLLESVAQHTANLLLVLNKADRVAASERSLAVEFTRGAIEKRLHKLIPMIWQVSATERLDDAAPGRDWQTFEQALRDLAEQSGSQMAQAAYQRGGERLCRKLTTIIHERRGALIRPVSESRARVAKLAKHVQTAQLSLRDLGPLMAAEQQAMSRVLSQRRMTFLENESDRSRQSLATRAQQMAFGSGPRYRRALLALAQEIARERLQPWMTAEAAFAADLYRQTLQRFSQFASSYWNCIQEAIKGPEDWGSFSEFPELDDRLSAKSQFYFHKMIHLARPVSPFGMLRDWLLGVLNMRGPFLKSAEEFLERLLEVNTSRVQNDFISRIETGRR